MFNRIDLKKAPADLNSNRAEVQTVDPEREISAETFFDQASALPFSVSPKQFAHRLTPSCISNSDFEGSESSLSCEHWIQLIDLWLNGQAGLFPIPIQTKHLKKLKRVLVEYINFSKKVNDPNLSPRQVGEELLQALSMSFEKGRVCYLPFGYTSGPKNDGHEIPCRCADKKKEIEAIFLNLGEGSQDHPLLDWTESAMEKYDFQFFPFHIRKEYFFGERGKQFLEAMVLLKRTQVDLTKTPYSAEDVYGALAAIGSIQQPSQEGRDKRSSKPQFTPTCADLAVVLIIKDVLFDLGYKKADVQRLFFIEKMWTLVAFASKEGLLIDDWTLVKQGVRDFSNKIVKVKDGVLSEGEKRICHGVLSLLSTKAEEQLEGGSSQDKKLLLNGLLPESVCTGTEYKIPKPEWNRNKQASKRSLSNESASLPEARFSEKEPILETFTRWEGILALNKAFDPNKICVVLNFLYEAFLTVPIPLPYEHDLWDELPVGSIEPLLNRLSSLQQKVMSLGEKTDSGFKKLYAGQRFVISTFIYLIADKLIRRKFSKQFEQFAPGFLPNSLQGFDERGDDLYFTLFPTEKASSQWSAALRYITTLKKENKRSLYPGLPILDVMMGRAMLDLDWLVKEKKQGKDSHAIQYLEFLTQFSNNPDPTAREYGFLWLLGGELIPKEIKTYLGIQMALLASAHTPTPSGLKGDILYFKFPERVSNFTSSGLHLVDHFRERELFEGPFREEIVNTLTENQAFCTLSLTEKGVSKEISAVQRDWLRLLCTESLTLFSLAIWMEEHFEDLKDRTVQNAIQHVLLHPKNISSLQQEPLVYTHLLSVLERGIEFYQNSHPSTLAFLICLTCALGGEKLSFEKLGDLEEKLCQFRRKEPMLPPIAYALRMVYRLGLPRGSDSLSELVDCELLLPLMKRDDSIPAGWILEGANGMERYEKRIQEQLQDQTWTKTLVNSIAAKLPPITDESKKEIIAHYPIISVGEIALHLLERRIYKKMHDTYLVLNYMDEETLPTVLDKRWAPFRIADSLSWSEGSRFCSSDGLLCIEQFEAGGRDFWPSRRFPGLENFGIQGWLDKLIGEWVEIPFFYHSSQFFFWNAGEKIVITEKTSKRPFALLVHGPEGIQVTKLTSSSQLGARLVLNPREIPEIASWMGSFGEKNGPAIWVDPQTQQITDLSFLVEGLTFEMEEKGLKSLQFPDFYLQPGKTAPELNHFEGALLLRREDETGVILLNRQIKSSTFNMSAKALYGERWRASTQTPFYFFKIDPLTGILTSNDPNAYMLLAAIFAAQKQYPKALVYLKKASSITSYLSLSHTVGSNVRDFFELKDRSPEALAFYLRFGMFLLSNHNQISQKRIAGLDNQEEVGELLAWLVEKMNRYIENQSLALIGKVPAELRLTIEEEKALLSKVLEQAKLSKQTFSLSPLERRLKLLTINSATISIQPRAYEMDWSFSKLVGLHDLRKVEECRNNPPLFTPETASRPLKVRFDSDDPLKEDFWSLYEGILKGEADLPMFFLKRSLIWKGDLKSYGLLLNFVYKNQALFKNLIYTSDSQKNRQVFEQILQVWSERTKKGRATFEGVQSCSLTFHYQKENIRLQVPPRPALHPLDWELIESEKLHTFNTRVKEHFKNRSPESYLEEAKRYYKTLQERFQALKGEVEKKANQVPETEIALGLRKRGGDLPRITFEGTLTQAYAQKNLNLLRAANPALGPKEIKRLLHKTVKGHLLKIQIHQLKLGIEALEQGDQAAFEKRVEADHEFALEEPESVLFQSQMGVVLREDQHALLDWEGRTASQYPRRIFHAPAGSGKTTTFLPIATNRCSRMGKTPFSLSTKALYQVDTDGLKGVAREAFDFDTTVFEILLGQKNELHHYRWIYEQLVERGEISGFKLTPEAFYALFLKYQLALDEADEESVEAIAEILAFFKKKGAAFIDEARVNGGPFTQAKIGIGDQKPLPKIDRAIFLDLYKAFLNPEICLEDGRSFPSIINLQKNRQAQISEEDKEAIKERLLSNKEWLRPLSGSNKKRAQALLDVYFAHFFHPSFELVGKMHYVRSLKNEEAIFVPAHVRQATTSYFEESYITLIVTIQGTLQEGLKDQRQARIFLEALVKSHREEIGYTSQPSSIEKQMRVWLQRPKFRLHAYKIDSEASIEKFYHDVKNCSEALFWFLEHVALDQIKYSTEQLTATPVHLLNAFNSVTLFSADPGPHALYGLPEKGEEIYQGPDILSEAKKRFLSPENSRVLTFKAIERPFAFFEALDRKVYKDLRMITDPGGMLRDFSVEELTEDFFLFLKAHPEVSYDGVIAFEDGTTSEHATRLMLWREGHEPKELNGHNIPEAIRSLGLDDSKMRFLTFIDPTHRAGANIEQPKNTSLLVLLGEGLTFSNQMQGALRGRGVLKKEQWIIWGGLDSLFVQMKGLTVDKIIEWAEKNEEEYRKKELPTSAYQQIDFEIARFAWSEIEKQSSGLDKIAVWQKYRDGFVTKVTVDPVKRFEGQMAPFLTEDVLQGYASEKYQMFGYKPSKQKMQRFDAAVASIISAVSNQVPTLPSAQVAVLSCTFVHTNQKQQTEVVQQQVTDEAHHLHPDGEYGSLPGIDSAGFLSRMIECSESAQKVFGSKYLTPNLSLTLNAQHTARRRGRPLKTKYLKKLQYVLLVEEKGVQHAFALADPDAAYFKKELNEKKGKAKVALIACTGFIVAHGENKKWADSVLLTPFVQDVQIDLALFCCELRSPERFIERAKVWSDFGLMWEKLKAAQPFFKRLYPFPVESLVPPAFLLSTSNRD